MIAVADGPGTLRFSITKIPMAERSHAIQSLYERKLFPVQLNPLSEKELRFHVTWKTLPGLSTISGFYAGLRADALTESAGNEDVSLGVSLGSIGAFTQRDRQLVIEPRTAIVTTREFGPFSLVGIEAGRHVGLRIPRKSIAPLVPNLDDAMKQLAVNKAGAATLLAEYIYTIAEDRTPLAPEFGQLLAQHVYDVVALLLSTNRDATELAKQRGVKAARLRVIKADIGASLGDCNLKASTIAARHGVTPRYLQKLFESEGTTFSAFVLRQRLTRAYRALSNPRCLDRHISSVAFEAGFGDLSHFNHCFRRHYGATPSDVRAEARTNVARTKCP